jgi:murein DD-endopeptidase MepM/ murein hydrolase activator NlpD
VRANRASLLIGIALILVPASCDRTGVEPPGGHGIEGIRAAVFDGRAGGNPHFHFLPPLAASISAPGDFDASLQPVVTVCEWGGSACAGPDVASFNATSGTGGEVVRVVAEDEHYIVNWHTDASSLTPGALYRIHVRVENLQLGSADILVVSDPRDLRNPTTGEPIPLVNGRTLPIKFRIDRGASRVAALAVGPSGGTVTLPSFGAVSVSPGTFPAATAVRLAATQSSETQRDFDETIPLPVERADWELRVELEATPELPIAVRIEVPNGFATRLPPGHSPALWVQIFHEGDLELHDAFVKLPAAIDMATGSLVAELPPYAFTTRRRLDGMTEAIVILGSAPETGNAANLGALASAAQDSCLGSPLRPPLDGELSVTSPYNGRTHHGTDYPAENGDVVRAAADGVVDRIGWDVRQLPEPDPRSGLRVKGWGRYVRLLHDDGSYTLYAHLVETSTDSLAVGDTVRAGDVIGRADNTGGSTGPHLHMEHVNADGERVDPHACIVREPADFRGRWVGTGFGQGDFGTIKSDWVWTLDQDGDQVSGRVLILDDGDDTGVLTGTVQGNVLDVRIVYGSTGATNTGRMTLTGNTMVGELLLTIGEFSAPFTATLTREGGDAQPAAAPPSTSGLVTKPVYRLNGARADAP